MKIPCIVSYIFCAACLALLGLNVQAQNPKNNMHPKVYVNGAYIGDGYSVSNSLMVPAQKLAPKFGYKVKVDEKAGAAYLTSDVKNTDNVWLPVEASKGNILYRDPVIINGCISAELDVKPALLAPSHGTFPVTLLVTARSPSGKVVHREEVTTKFPDTGGRFFLKTEPFTSEENITSFEFVLSTYPSSNAGVE